MYEFIKGKLDQLTPTQAIVEAGGVGYFLHISLQTYTQIGEADEVKLYTHFIVREDAQVLYGFYTAMERDIFRLLLGVSGVGGNTARMILSSFLPEEVRSIISGGQAEVLKSVKGLGIKTAQKIIVELRDKIIAVTGEPSAGSVALASSDNEAFNEALSALMMLGFVRTSSEKALRGVQKDKPDASVEELIRMALKSL